MTLTEQQERVLRLVQESARPMSVRDVCAELGLSSTSTAHSHLAALERAGLIEKVQGWREVGK